MLIIFAGMSQMFKICLLNATEADWKGAEGDETVSSSLLVSVFSLFLFIKQQMSSCK